MAVNTNDYASPLSQDTSRGYSNSIWADCPISDFKERGGQVGTLFEDDFMGGGGTSLVSGIPTFTTNQSTLATTGTGTFGQWNALLVNASGRFGQAADFTNLPLEGGWLGLLSGASGAEINLQAMGGAPFGFVNASATTGAFRGKMWFECSVALSSLVSTGNAMFIGLAGTDGGAAATPVSVGGNFLLSSTTASGLIAASNSFFGFYKPSASPLVNATNPTKTLLGSLFNDWIAGVYNVKAGTIQFPGSASNLWTILSNTGFGGTTQGAAGTTQTAATFTSGAFTNPSTMRVKLGWVFDPTPACPQVYAPVGIAGGTTGVTTNQTPGTLYSARIRFYVNGQLATAFLTGADIQATTFPSVWMHPMIAFQAGAGTAGVAYVDWVRAAQLASY